MNGQLLVTRTNGHEWGLDLMIQCCELPTVCTVKSVKFLEDPRVSNPTRFTGYHVAGAEPVNTCGTQDVYSEKHVQLPEISLRQTQKLSFQLVPNDWAITPQVSLVQAPESPFVYKYGIFESGRFFYFKF